MDESREILDVNAIKKELETLKAAQRDVEREIENSYSSHTSIVLEEGGEKEGESARRIEIGDALTATTRRIVRDVRSQCEATKETVVKRMKTADQVSSTIRRLHLAQSRAEGAERYVENLMDLNECVDEVEKDMNVGDFEKARVRLEWYMSAQHLLAPTHRVETNGAAGSEQRERILKCRDDLISELRSSLQEVMATSSSDGASTAKICSALSMLGDVDTVHLQLGGYLRQQVVQLAERCIAELASSGENESDEELARAHEQAFSKLINRVDHLAREHVEKKRVRQVSHEGQSKETSESEIDRKDRLFRQKLLLNLHEEADSQAAQIVESYIRRRELRDHARKIPSLDPVKMSDKTMTQLDIMLDEMAVMAQHAETYRRYVHGMARYLSTTNDNEDGEEKQSKELNTSMSRVSKLQIVVQEMAGFFILFDSIFMRSAIARAHRLEEITKQGSPAYSSVVEDVFFILQRCSSRAVATGHVDIVCAVFNNISNTLSEDLLHVFTPRMDGISVRQGPEHQLRRSKDAGVVVANSLGVAAEFCTKLHGSLTDEMDKIWPKTAADDESKRQDVMTVARGKLGSFLNEIDNQSKRFEKGAQTTINALCDVLQLRGLVESAIPELHYDMKPKDYDSRRSSNVFARQFLGPLQVSMEQFTAALTERNATRLSERAAKLVVKRVLRQIMRKRYNQLGALQLDADIRLLTAVFGAFIGRANARKITERLTRVSAFLNVEHPEDAVDLVADMRNKSKMTVTIEQVHRILSLRVDFEPELIKAVRIE